jgi:hypothetical protein
MEKTNLNIGDRVRFGNGAAAGKTWTVKSLDPRFVILTRKNDEQYSIIDWERGVRGPCDLIGQGWDCTGDGADELLRALNYHLEACAKLDAGAEKVVMEEISTEVSYRNNVPIEIVWHRGPKGPVPEFG